MGIQNFVKFVEDVVVDSEGYARGKEAVESKERRGWVMEALQVGFAD